MMMTEEITEQMKEAVKHLKAMVALGANYKEARHNAAIIFGVDSYDLGVAFESLQALKESIENQ
jgi:hypothetical protein